ncbi:MAG: uracil-DNA glycosylase [Bacteroidales bacterium]|nr:uracil-DNA glycosylase [Bacteroidales bacterium]
MAPVNPLIEETWKEKLTDEFNAPYFSQLKSFLVEEKTSHQVYPPGSQIFNAFNYTPFNKVKVIILGQDPYHGSGQAHGLSFSVPAGIKQPPSLQNIFKEIKSDLGIPLPAHGNLENWAKQGVLLLNAILTVRAGQASSHQNKGWEQFTDAAIKRLSEERENLVFLLWGNFAIAKKLLIDSSRHLILSSTHPSPFSVHRGFFGNKHFSKTNQYLKSHGIGEVDWRV